MNFLETRRRLDSLEGGGGGTTATTQKKTHTHTRYYTTYSRTRILSIMYYIAACHGDCDGAATTIRPSFWPSFVKNAGRVDTHTHTYAGKNKHTHFHTRYM